MTESTTGSTIEVVAWADLEALPRALDDLGEQVAAVVGHATRWVCSRDGFEPSPVCVLLPWPRPRAELKESVLGWAEEQRERLQLLLDLPELLARYT